MQASQTQLAQRIQKLEGEQEELRLMASLVDAHAQDLAAAVQRKRTHLANIAGITRDIALAKQSYEQLGEQLSGSGYSALIGHIEHYQTALAAQQKRVLAQINELRQQLEMAREL